MNVISKKALLDLSETYTKGTRTNKDQTTETDNLTLNQIWDKLLGEVPEFARPAVPRYFAKLELGDTLRRRDQPDAQPSPFLVEDAKRIFRSHPRMLQAESLACEFIEALKPWESFSPDRIIWHFFERPFLNVAYLGSPFDFARDTLWESLDNQGHESVDNSHLYPTRFDVGLKNTPSLVKKAVQANAGWRYAVENDLSISGPKYAIQRPDWCRFADLVNPFDLLISIWKTECFVFDIPTEEDTALRMYIRR